MAYKFKNQTVVNGLERRVYDLAEDEERKRSGVLVEMSGKAVRDKWGLTLDQEGAVRAKFDEEKLAHLKAAEAKALSDYDKVVTYQIG